MGVKEPAGPQPTDTNWYRDRTLGAHWDGIQNPVEQEQDLQARLRGEALTELGTFLDLVTKGERWVLKDCEAGSLLVERLAELLTRMRASIAREGTLQ
jgi:hypothetical protein